MAYRRAFICRNGHVISTSIDWSDGSYCTKCGSPILGDCPNCSHHIFWDPYLEPTHPSSFERPAYCKFCGKPYPWTAAALEAATHMLKESDLTADDQRKVIEILPDAISATPRTQLAALRFQKAMANAGTFVAEGLRQFAIDFGCEFLKKQLGL